MFTELFGSTSQMFQKLVSIGIEKIQHIISMLTMVYIQQTRQPNVSVLNMVYIEQPRQIMTSALNIVYVQQASP